MKRKYETTFFIKDDLVNKANAIAKKYENFILYYGGFVTSTTITKDEGVKIEICFEFESTSSYACVAGLEYGYKKDDDVLRFIVIRTE